MNKKLLFKFILSIMFFPVYKTSAQIVLTQQTADQYAEKIIGHGITWSNVIVAGSPDAIASYTGGTSAGLTPVMENGIVLSTGSLAAENAMNGPSSIFKSTTMGIPGFSELTTIVGQPTYDGIMLQFDMISVTEIININFQFGSEEYNEYVGSTYNDVFAFIISGPGFPGEQDLAILSAVSPPVRICTSTVNCGNVCPPTNSDGTNCPFFINNCEGDFDNAMNGYTTMLNVRANVIPCETYTIKLMIADIEDAEYDSWILLQENGFYSVGAIVDAQVSYVDGGAGVIEGCMGNELIFSIPEPLEYYHTIEIDWSGGTATPGLDYLDLPTSITIPAGETSVVIPVIAIEDGIVEGIETIIGTYQKNQCEEEEIIIEIHENSSGCCHPTSVFNNNYISTFLTNNAIENITYNSPEINQNGYGNYMEMIVSQVAGGSFNFSMDYVEGANGVKIWIDWNNDSLFEEEEVVFYLANENANKTGTIMVPADKVSGNYVMRLRAESGQTANPSLCEQITYGEALDFTLSIPCLIEVDPPTADSQQILAQGQTLADLIVNGDPEANFIWYSDSLLTTEIPVTTEAADQTTYYVTQIVEGCESNAQAIFVEVPLSNVVFDKKSFMAYPNAVSGIFNVSYTKEIIGIEVINMLGQTIISKTVNSKDVQIDMSILPAGNYLVKVRTDGAVKTVKVVKQ